MDKKLPGVFANKIDKNIRNNEQVYYSKLSDNEEVKIDDKIQTPKLNMELNVNQKINRIFSSSKYVYKADVRIKMQDEQIECRIIGRNSTHLITIDNKLIPIGKIVDIDFIEKNN